MRIHRDDLLNFPRFAMSTDEIYTDKTCFIGTGDSQNLKVALGILNSKVGRYQLGSLVSKMDDGGWLMQKIYIEKVMVPRLSETQRQQIESLVDNIKDTKLKHSTEDDLDACLYAFYGLDDDEIKHIAQTSSASLTKRK